MPWDRATLAETPRPHAESVVVPIAVEPSPASGAPRDIAALTYAANPDKKGLDRVLAAWAKARSGGEQLVVAGADLRIDAPGVRVAGRLAPADYRALLRRAHVFLTAPRREDFGIAQLEALADGCMLVTTAAPGPVRGAAARPRARPAARRRGRRQRRARRGAADGARRAAARLRGARARGDRAVLAPRDRRRRARRAASAPARLATTPRYRQRATPNDMRARTVGRPSTATSSGTQPGRVRTKPPENPVTGPTRPS